MGPRATLPWCDLLRFAFRDLGLRPSEFWVLTPFELFVILGLDLSQEPLSRDLIERLEAEISRQKNEQVK